MLKRCQSNKVLTYPGRLGMPPPACLLGSWSASPPTAALRRFLRTNKVDKESDAWEPAPRQVALAEWWWHSLRLLMKFYEIDPHSKAAKEDLLAALLQDHVPAFQLDKEWSKHWGPQSKKPVKLDVRGSTCLYMRSCLKKVREQHTLRSSEEELLANLEAELKRTVGGSTLRALTREMEALSSRSVDVPTDFQRLLVQQVEPYLNKLLRSLGPITGEEAPKRRDAIAAKWNRYLFAQKK